MLVQRAWGLHPKAPGISLCRHLCSTSQGTKGEGAAGAPERSIQQHPRHQEGSLQQWCLPGAACSLLGQMELHAPLGMERRTQRRSKCPPG